MQYCTPAVLLTIVTDCFLRVFHVLAIFMLGCSGVYTFILSCQRLLRHFDYSKLPITPYPSQLAYIEVAQEGCEILV